MASKISSSNSHHTILDPTQNLASIFYLYPSNHTNTKFVSTLFYGHGYCDWKRSIIIGLTAKNKMSSIDGTLRKPAANDDNLIPWERCNNMVLGWLIASLERTTACSVMYF